MIRAILGIIGVSVLVHAGMGAADFTLPGPAEKLNETITQWQAALVEAEVLQAADLYDADGVAMATAVLTRPDDGPGGRTYRWEKQQVTYRINASYPDDYQAIIRDALHTAAAVAGMTALETSGPADIEVVGKADRGAYVRAQLHGMAIGAVTVELGCCSERAAREDLTQAFGAFGDWGDGRSIFSNQSSVQAPTDWDWWALRALYALPSGSSPEAVAAQLAATTPKPPGS